jgi:hypothetical protein
LTVPEATTATTPVYVRKREPTNVARNPRPRDDRNTAIAGRQSGQKRPRVATPHMPAAEHDVLFSMVLRGTAKT